MSVDIPLVTQEIGRFAYENFEVENVYGTDEVKKNDEGEILYALVCRFTPLGQSQAITARVKIYLPEEPSIGDDYPMLDFTGFAISLWEKNRSLGANFKADGFKVLPKSSEAIKQVKQQTAQQQVAKTQETRAAARRV